MRQRPDLEREEKANMRIFKRKGSPHWWATWNDQNGQRHRKSTGTNDKNLAQTLAGKWQQESFMEHHFGIIPDFPFQEALLRYANERKRQNAKSYEESLKYRLQFLLDRFGKLNLSQITAMLLQDTNSIEPTSMTVVTGHTGANQCALILGHKDKIIHRKLGIDH